MRACASGEFLSPAEQRGMRGTCARLPLYVRHIYIVKRPTQHRGVSFKRISCFFFFFWKGMDGARRRLSFLFRRDTTHGLNQSYAPSGTVATTAVEFIPLSHVVLGK